MTSRWMVALVLAGAWVANAEVVVTSEVSAVSAVADTTTNQAAVNGPAPVAAPAPVIEPIPAEPAGQIPGVDAQGFALEKFSIGTRITHYELTTERKDFFLGHINRLEAVEDYAPTKLYADWWMCRYSGVELTWDRVEAKTHNNDPEGISDGNMVAQGPIATVLLRLPNSTRVTPMIGVGWAFMSVSFDELPWWSLGYGSPADYEALGSPSAPRGKTREMMPKDNASGLVLTADVDVRLAAHWSVDLYVRNMDLDAKMGYRTAGEIKAAKTIPLGNTAMGLGVKYVF